MRCVLSLAILFSVVAAAARGPRGGGGSSSSGSMSRLRRLYHPDSSLRGMHFAPEQVDVATCAGRFFSMLTAARPDGELEELTYGSLHCAPIGRKRPPLVHCSVLMETSAGNHIQMHLTPFPPGNTPEKLLVECRTVARNEDEAVVQGQDLYLTPAGGIGHKDKGLTAPYVAYPPGQRYQFNKDKGVDVQLIGGERINSLTAAVYLWVQKVPGFFQLVIHDCQTFAVQFLNVFTLGPGKSRVNKSKLASAYLKTFFRKPCDVRFSSLRNEYASDADIATLQTKYFTHMMGQTVDPDDDNVPTLSDEEVAGSEADVEDDNPIPPVHAVRRKVRRERIVPKLTLHVPDETEDREVETDVIPAIHPMPRSRVFDEPRPMPLVRTFPLSTIWEDQPVGEEESHLVLYKGHLVDAILEVDPPLEPKKAWEVRPPLPPKKVKHLEVPGHTPASHLRFDDRDSGVDSEHSTDEMSSDDGTGTKPREVRSFQVRSAKVHPMVEKDLAR